jgi:hypothetical protein
MGFNGRTGTDILKNYINNIKSDIGEAYDVDYFLVGDNVNDADYIFKYPDVYENMGYKLNKLGGSKYFYTGRSIYPILDFYKNHTQYDKYFIIEYDTYYTGSFKEFFDNININGDIDIIIPKPEYGVKNWYWYRFGGDKKIDNIQEINYIRVLGLSNKGKKILKDAKNNTNIPIITKFKKEYESLFQNDIRASKVYSLITNYDYNKDFMSSIK